jgi:ribose transport system substrate-binding protein
MLKGLRSICRLEILSLVLLVVSCGQAEESLSDPASGGDRQSPLATNRPLQIGFSQYTLGAPYFVELVNSARREAEARGHTVFVVDAQDSMNKQLADVEDLLARNIDLLILNAKDPVGAIPAARIAAEAGVPIIEVDSSIDPTAPVVTTIQSNNTENGKLVGRWLASQFSGTLIRAALISGSKGNPVGRARRQGINAGIVMEQMEASGRSVSESQAAEYAREIDDQLRTMGSARVESARFEIVAQGWGNWTHEGGLTAMEDILVAYPDVDCLIAENDSMALGAIEAIKEARKEEQIIVVAGADGQKEALALIKAGRYGATGMNNPTLIGKMAVEVGLSVLQGETSFPKIYYTPAVVINQENVDQYYDPDGPF